MFEDFKGGYKFAKTNPKKTWSEKPKSVVNKGKGYKKEHAKVYATEDYSSLPDNLLYYEDNKQENKDNKQRNEDNKQ